VILVSLKPALRWLFPHPLHLRAPPPQTAADPSTPPGSSPARGVGNEPPSPKMRIGQWCTNDRQHFYKKMPAARGFFPCHSKTGSGRLGPYVKGGFAAYLLPMEGGGFGPGPPQPQRHWSARFDR